MRNHSRFLHTASALPAIAAIAVALGFGACASAPPPRQLSDARIALEEARRANADELAVREYDAAARHLSVAESTWRDKHDAATAAHWARRAEAAARQAQYEAEARTAEEEVRRETDRRSRAELAVRDAEIALLHSQARSEAEQRALEAEIRVEQERRRSEQERARREDETEERQRLEQELERRQSEAEQIQREAEQTQRETEARLREEQEERRRVEEQRQAEAAQAEDQRQAETARAAELERLRDEQQRTREELRATLSRLAEVRQEARGLIVTLPGSIYFAVNKSIVQTGMRSRLTEIAGALARSGSDSRILIEGHTDSDGSNEYNLELSSLRAEAVRSVLVAGGVSPDRIETRGYGETRPIAPNTSASGKAQNRRVEIVIEGSAAAGGR
jgi:outer membrane protein OmpA-like peptidoglycan-associated protein